MHHYPRRNLPRLFLLISSNGCTIRTRKSLTCGGTDGGNYESAIDRVQKAAGGATGKPCCLERPDGDSCGRRDCAIGWAGKGRRRRIGATCDRAPTAEVVRDEPGLAGVPARGAPYVSDDRAGRDHAGQCRESQGRMDVPGAAPHWDTPASGRL